MPGPLFKLVCTFDCAQSDIRTCAIADWAVAVPAAHVGPSVLLVIRGKLAAAPAPHKDFSDLYGRMSGKGESAGGAHTR